jgi:hypothetical protein
MKLMSLIVWSWWLMLALASCGDGHPAANGGSCDDGAACDCPGGRSGSSVCDVDTRAFVMCRCDMPTQRGDDDADAGSDRPRPGAAGSGGERAHAGQTAATDGGQTAAANGGKTTAADGGMMAAGGAGSDQGDQAGEGEAGKGAAGHPGKALGHTKDHGPDH